MTFRTMQELLRHNDLNTTMIHTHVLNKGWAGCARSFRQALKPEAPIMRVGLGRRKPVANASEKSRQLAKSNRFKARTIISLNCLRRHWFIEKEFLYKNEWPAFWPYCSGHISCEAAMN